jgi:putative ABC transport system permease protein
MIPHYLIAAWRNMMANKLLSAIAIFGLAIGIAAALLMAAVIRNQLSFDHFIPGHERTYIAVTRDNPQFTKPVPCPGVPYCQRGMTALAPKLNLAAPEIEAITRLAYTALFNGDEPLQLQAGAVTGREMLYWADPNAFDVLPLPVMHGDLATALARPDGIVLPRAMALKYFGRDDVVGRTILLEGHPMTVRAVIRDLPANGTSLMSGIFAAGTAAFSPIAPNRPGGPPVYTYLRLKPGASVAAVENRITAIADAFTATLGQPMNNEPRNLTLGKLLRLDRTNLDEFNNPGISARLVAAALAGLMVLLIALVNFINLTMARSGRREKDVGVRKSCGASRAALIAQFLGEAMLAVLLATILALAAGEWLMPAVNAFLRTGARLSDPLLPLLLAGVLASGLAAGAWPAFILSGFRPAITLRGLSSGEDAGLIRSLLVALQFAMLIALAIAAAVVWQQRGYAMREALQVDSSNMVMVRINASPAEPWAKDMRAPEACPAAFRDAVRRLPDVRDVRCTSQSFLTGTMTINWFAKGGALQTLSVNQVDPGIFALYGVTPLAGTLANANGSILNLAALKLLGFPSPQAAIGQDWLDRLPRDELDTYRGRIKGHSRVTAVVPDFTFASVAKAVSPAMFSAWQESPPARAIHIKLSGNNVPETLAAIDRAWSSSGQVGAINRVFVRDYVAQFYQDMLREAQFFSAFVVIAIFLACLGLVGIAVATAERRTKEIGVRKAMGAGDGRIVLMLLWQFAQPVLWANVVAWPAAWWLMQRWLAGYSRHIELQPWLFIAASVVALLLALGTVAGQAWLTARAKPVLALRYE